MDCTPLAEALRGNKRLIGRVVRWPKSEGAGAHRLFVSDNQTGADQLLLRNHDIPVAAGVATELIVSVVATAGAYS